MRSGIWRFAVAPCRHLTPHGKLQYKCTTTITQVHNSPKVVWENLLPVCRVVGLESWTWTQVGLESDFLRTWTGLGLEGQGLGLGLGLEG